MIYSRKYGRSFNSRSEFQRYVWRDARTKPLLPWFGLRDCLYSDEWKQEHNLPTTGERLTSIFVALGLLVVVLGGLLLLAGILEGALMMGVGLLCFWGCWRGNKEERD